MNILVAEDDMVSSMVLVTKLKKQGHGVFTAVNGRDAWYLFRKESPRIVITDWMMPVMDGLELVGLIRGDATRRNYTYIIMLTALSTQDRYLEGMSAGADDFITKPFDMDVLNARIRVAERVVALQTEVVQLEKLLPICMYCKKIRDGENIWHVVEDYVGSRSETTFATTLCPTCRQDEQRESRKTA